MIGRSFMLASGISLLLFAAIVVLWVRSYWVSDTITWGPNRLEMTTVHTVPGGFHWRGPSEKTAPIDFTLGYWQFLPLTMVLPLWPLMRRFGQWDAKRRRGAKGRREMLGREAATHFCRTCGYDLRASTGRCPECGTPIPSDVGTPA